MSVWVCAQVRERERVRVFSRYFELKEIKFVLLCMCVCLREEINVLERMYMIVPERECRDPGQHVCIHVCECECGCMCVCGCHVCVHVWPCVCIHRREGKNLIPFVVSPRAKVLDQTRVGIRLPSDY